MTRWLLPLAAAAGLLAQTEWTAPLAGLRRAADGRLFRVYGLAGNFVLAPHEAGGVRSAAFSGRTGILKFESSLALLDAAGRTVCEQVAPAGPAIAAFDEHGALQAVLLADLPAGDCAIEAWEPPAGALAAASRRGRPRVLANREDGLWLVAETGDERLDERRAEAAVFAGARIVYAAGEELVVRHPDGSRESLALPAPAADMAPMGENWTALRAGPFHFALRTDAGPARLFPLPSVEVAP